MKIFLTLCLIFIQAHAIAEGVSDPLDLTIGGYRDSETNEFSDPYIGRRLLEAGAYGLTGFSNLGRGDIYHVLIGPHIAEINIETKSAVSSTPLRRWPYEYLETEYQERLRIQREDIMNRPLRTHDQALGCLSAKPLRYGSVDDTGEDYLVIFMGNDLLVFSPTRGKVVFGANLALSDWMSSDGTRVFYEDDDGVLQVQERDPQFASNLVAQAARWGSVPLREPGYRGYGKLYFDDFSEDETPDILLWRKLYVSGLVEDDTEGFEHVRDTLIHYQLIDGEYQPQETEEDVIRGWLSENDLTWQSGYPSKSECEGEAGELIPEMHDPLLNDPDVLE